MIGEADTNRLEAFSDGVFAIAITLLILEVKIDAGGGSLAHRFAQAWPSYVSFLISFAVIGTMWLNHHQMFRLVRTTDHGVVVANLFLLLVISVIPFPTKVLGDWPGAASPISAPRRWSTASRSWRLPLPSRCSGTPPAAGADGSSRPA